MARASYKRILLKLSGEIFGGAKKYGLDLDLLRIVAKEIQATHKLGVNIAIIVGGGNIFRGVAGAVNGIDRATGDYMGMLATAINSLAIQDALEKIGVPSRVQTAIEMKAIAEPFIRRRAIRHMEKGRVVILAAGTGNPYFSTDTAAALRAAELDADVIIKATKVDGVYDKDPVQFTDAKRFKRITHMELIQRRLKVMDSTAASLCMENNIPIIVLDLLKSGNVKKAAQGKEIGTLVSNE
ncbi:UMP kinase [candidate division WOR-1 bacterium RIFOXYB2_FULL_48_7]|uniref:Uridylate kinase n=1 Tax=candidate division WOR-1 bacterium RIFOXYB2_FULL_48_7 TaxID=1802583 RepID=A0A1F4TWC4_UNCSA|nr:MAG: UMP kinase [candidate division WOR-1 bacterium RIFOXYB2_FULL_48_7]